MNLFIASGIFNLVGIIAAILVIIFVGYVAVRIWAYAWFRTKFEYESKKKVVFENKFRQLMGIHQKDDLDRS